MITIRSSADRQRAALWATKAPAGTRIEFKSSRRSLPQNDRMWAMLTDIARQLPWHGVKLTPDDWKLVFLDALKREVRMVPNIDGNGFVVLGKSTSKMTVREMRDLIELAQSFGAQQGVKFGDESRRGFDWVAAYGRAAA